MVSDMSYCRFSSDDFMCDVYVYETIHGGFQVHVAGNRLVYKEPIPPEVPIPEKNEGPEFEAFVSRYRTMQRMRDEAEREYIDLPYAGDTFGFSSAGECANKLEELRTLGYNVPQYAIDALREEQRTKEN